MAARAHWLGAAAGPHVDLDAEAVRAKPCLLVDEARKVLTLIEKADQPHATKTQSERHVDDHPTGPESVWGCAGGVLPGSGTVAKKLDVRGARCCAWRADGGMLQALPAALAEFEPVRQNAAQASRQPVAARRRDHLETAREPSAAQAANGASRVRRSE